MNLYKHEKAELIKNGTLGKYREMQKEAYNAGYEPSQDPADYFIFANELEKTLCDRINLQTKRKKQKSRNHTDFMRKTYDHIGFLELGYSNTTRDKSTLETKKRIVCRILDQCFDDYHGKPEISPNGKLHFHFLVAWNGTIPDENFFKSYRDGHEVILIKYPKLQQLWYGVSKIDDFGNKQPSKYGIYDLVYVPNTKDDCDRMTNYVLKNLNTMDSYILKDEAIDLENVVIDDELLFDVNNSNMIVKRDTPFQKYNKAYIEQKKYIKHQCRVFDTPFYEANKYSPFKVFQDWAQRNIGAKALDYCEIIPSDFKLVSIDDF